MNELEENQQTVKKSGFGRGLIFGVIAGLSIAILAGVVLSSERIGPYRSKWRNLCAGYRNDRR